MATLDPSAGGGTSGSNRWEKTVYGVLAAVTAAAGLYWLVAAEAWAMQLHGALFLAFGATRRRAPSRPRSRWSRRSWACAPAASSTTATAAASAAATATRA